MWFAFKKDVAPLYKDETGRRMFATASGRPRGADKLKKLKIKSSKEIEKSRFPVWLGFRPSEQGQQDGLTSYPDAERPNVSLRFAISALIPLIHDRC
jgi:hypothetical protein